MPKIKPLLNDVVHLLNEVYERFPTLINWSIAIGILIVLSKLDVKP